MHTTVTAGHAMAWLSADSVPLAIAKLLVLIALASIGITAFVRYISDERS
jgi:hypothetical protein